MEKGKFMEVQFVQTYEYLYTLGGLTPFFEALKEKQILGAHCPQCGKTYCPARVHCPSCYVPTEWIPLSGAGTVEVSAMVAFVPRKDKVLEYLDLPYTLAMIKLDGADNALLSVVHQQNQKLGDVYRDMRVKAVFRPRREGRLTDFYFVPETGL